MRVIGFAVISLSVLLGSAGVPGAQAQAANFYVDNSCPFNGDGRAVTCAASAGASGAWNSLGAASFCTGMVPGDHLQIRAGIGVYTEGWYATMSPDAGSCSGTATQPIVFENYPGENVVVDGAQDIRGTLAKWTAIGNGVYLCNTAPCGTDERWPFMAWYQMVGGVEQELYLEHVSRACDITVPPGWMRYTLDNAVCVHLRENVSPGADTVAYLKTNTVLAVAFQLHVAPGVKHWRLQKNPLGGSFTIKRFRDHGIVASSDVNIDIVVDGVDIGFMRDRCIDFDTGAIARPVGWQVLNSHIHHCGQEGVHSGVDSSANYRIENNDIHHIQTPPYVQLCGDVCAFSMDRGTGIRVAEMGASTGAVIRGNRIHDSCGGFEDGRCNAINVEGGGSNLTLENNLIWNLSIQKWPYGGHGVLFSLGSCIRCTIRNNRFYNVDSCVTFEGTFGFSLGIYNNTCVNPWHIGIATEYGSLLGNITIVNNIFYSTTAPRGALLEVDPGSLGVRVPTYNAFYCGSGCVSLLYRNLTFANAAVAGIGIGNRWGDPNLDLSGVPPQLNILSPAGSAYRNGLVLNPVFPDYLGTPRPAFGLWDIGAHEYTTSPATPPVSLPAIPPPPSFK